MRRGQIVAAAIDTIATLGYNRASLAEVARRAGISKSVISYHFSGKNELIREVVAEVYSLGTTFMVPRIAAAPDARGALRAYIEGNLEFFRAHRKHVIALVEVLGGLPPESRDLSSHVAGIEEALPALERILRRGQSEGQFGEFSTRVMALAIRSVVDSLPPQLSADPDFDLDTYSRELVGLFDRATRADAGAASSGT